MTLTQTTTPCCLGTFEGFNHRDQSAIEAVLTADEVIAWNHDEHGEAEFWPSGDAQALSGIFTRHVTASELLAVRRLVEEVGGDEETALLRIQFACTVLGENLHELTVDALDDQQPSIFFGRNRWDVRKEAAYKLFETYWPECLLSTCRWCEAFFLWPPNLPDQGDKHVDLAVAAGAGTVVRLLDPAGWPTRHPFTPLPRTSPALARSRAFATLRRIR